MAFFWTMDWILRFQLLRQPKKYGEIQGYPTKSWKNMGELGSTGGHESFEWKTHTAPRRGDWAPGKHVPKEPAGFFGAILHWGMFRWILMPSLSIFEVCELPKKCQHQTTSRQGSCPARRTYGFKRNDPKPRQSLTQVTERCVCVYMYTYVYVYVYIYIIHLHIHIV